MLGYINVVFAPLVSLILFVISSSFYTTFISVRLQLEGMSTTTIGYVHAAFYGGFLLGSAKVERLIRRVGHIRSFAAFSSIFVATILLQGVYISEMAWIVLRFCNGVCLASLYVVVESWLLSKSSKRTRGSILALYMFTLYASQSISQLIIGYVDPMTAIPFLVSGILASLSILPLSLTKAASPEVHEPAVKNLLRIIRLSPFGSLACLLSGLILSAFYSFTPNFAQMHDISVSYIMSLTIAGGFLLQWPIGKLSDIFKRNMVLTLTSLVAIFPCILIMIIPEHDMIVLVSAFVLGGLTFTIYPLGITQVCDRVSESDIHSTTGLLSLIYGIGATLGPLTAPFVMMIPVLGGLHLYFAIVLTTIFVIGLYSIYRRPPIAHEDRNEYIPAHPRTTPVAGELEPRRQ